MVVTLVSYKGDLVRLVFDTGNSVMLPVTIEYSKYFKKGLSITEDEYHLLHSTSEKYLCITKAIGLIARSAKSEFQIIQYLKKKKYSADSIAGALVYLREKQFINDEDFAKRFALSLSKRKEVGSRMLFSELQKKGIKKTIAQKALSEVDLTTDNHDTAYSAAIKKIKTLTGKNDIKIKVWRFLKSRGFSDDIIYSVLKKMKNEGFFSLEKNDD
jgi:regulatory protein